ncbi:hypothetical protein [Niabella aurantiaca]|uniref:hypothetical protein n=1 Tax=Niabella aurantiaca TaxID=379900 RepID=UPI00035F7697|nr:hypothetical protein [Niabella aurantiaca]
MTQIVKKINELERIDDGYCMELINLVGAIANLAEPLIASRDIQISERGCQIVELAGILRKRIDCYDFEVVENLRKMAKAAAA